MVKIEKMNIAVIGLGYVGLPLAVEFGKKFNVVGYDCTMQSVRASKAMIGRMSWMIQLLFLIKLRLLQ